jgi:hypothetical protein
MAHRSFRDGEGREWDAWEVVPTAVERRLARPDQARWPKPERRRALETRVLVPDQLQKGWLAFQSGSERKRLAPIPSGWAELEEPDLAALLKRADRRSRARRTVE